MRNGECPNCKVELSQSMRERVDFENYDGDEITLKIVCYWCPKCQYVERVEAD